AAHLGVALGDVHAAAERGLLILVAHLERGSLDFHGQVAVLRESLQRIDRALRLLGRCRPDARQHSRRNNGQARAMNTTTHQGPTCARTEPTASPRLSVMVTPRSNRMTLPFSDTSSRLASSVPLNILISTGFSETTVPLRVLITASLRRP